MAPFWMMRFLEIMKVFNPDFLLMWSSRSVFSTFLLRPLTTNFLFTGTDPDGLQMGKVIWRNCVLGETFEEPVCVVTETMMICACSHVGCD